MDSNNNTNCELFDELDVEIIFDDLIATEPSLDSCSCCCVSCCCTAASSTTPTSES